MGSNSASIFGPILADMALGEEARFKEFKIDRFALSAPVFPPRMRPPCDKKINHDTNL